VIRGVEGRAIFHTRSDFEDFLARFALLVIELGFRVLAWTLLRNHAHFVLATGRTPLSVLMARLNGRHALRFNRLNARTGHLFQGRYKAVLIEHDAQLTRTLAYVLGNAARHRVVPIRELSHYPWSMYGALVGRRGLRAFEAIGPVSDAFGGELQGLARRIETEALAPAAPAARLEPDQIEELDRIIRACCEYRGVPTDTLRTRAAASQVARAEIATVAQRALDLPLSEIARRVGLPYTSAVRLVRNSAGQSGSGTD
jgi:REP element-mobilizing transposase RayT